MTSTFSHSFTSSPHTPDQWNLVLQRVKLLYVQRQYKQCASRAEEILRMSTDIHAVYKTYLYFYSAISYETLGQAAHNYSSNKIAFLHSALDCFTTCSAILPSTIPIPRPNVVVEEEDQYSRDTSLADSSPYDSLESSFTEDSSTVTGAGTGGLVGDLTRIIDDSMEWDEEDPFISDSGVHPGDTFPYKIPRDDSNRALLMPSPLQIRKSEGILEGEQAANRQPVRSRRPPPLPIKTVPYKDTDTRLQEHSEAIETPLTITRYNNTIQFLRSQFTTNITSTQTLIDQATGLQRARKASKTLRRAASFWSFSPASKPGAEMNMDGLESGSGSFGATMDQQQESKEERIARLRAEGWKVGLRDGRRRGWKGSEYYKAYCNSVLDELYLDE